MNNILSFNEYNGYELERMVYDEMLNEKSSTGKGIRGFFNRRAASKVRSELEEEIELSKSIMQGIQDGLETLNDNFDALRKNIDNGDNDSKGKKQKVLDEIIKIIEDSKKRTWDINELIDEGEIDYTGFTANIGIASVAYFGILLTPFRAAILIHKGYNYFFNIVKNTIRKALVMLQLNFDQFENLIIAKGFQSADYLEDVAAAQKLDDTIAAVLKELCGKKTGMIKSKTKAADYRKNIDIAYKRVKLEMEQNKRIKQSQDVYNNLDPYNNTYTKSLEALRQYTSDDVQKHLDAIKTSMSKLAGQEVDLQTYSELIIAAAEEHAFKVSSSIYNKFAKMTEVFNLPNQKKLIDLIEASTQEEMDLAEKELKRLNDEEAIKKAAEQEEELESSGTKVFTSISGVEIGEFDKETKKYKESEIKGAKGWTYDKFRDLDDEEKDDLLNWLSAHPEVLKQCSKTLQVSIHSSYNEGYYVYVDSLIDYVGRCLVEGSNKNESQILNFDDYIFEGKGNKGEYKLDKATRRQLKSKFNEVIDEISDKLASSEAEDSDFDDVSYTIDNLLNLVLGDDYEEKIKNQNYTDEEYAKLVYILNLYEEKEDEDYYNKDVISDLKEKQKKMDISKSSKKYYFDLNKLDKSQVDDLKDLYQGKVNERVASVALEVIGNKLLKDKTFVKNRKNIIDIINKSFDEETVSLSMMTYELLKDAKEELKDIRSHDYNMEDEEDTKNGEK